MKERMQLASPDLNCLLDQNLLIFSVLPSSPPRLPVFYLLIYLREQIKSTESASDVMKPTNAAKRLFFTLA